MTAVPASARPAVVDPGARATAEAAITARLAELNARVTLVNQSPALTASDHSSLLAELNGTISGLQALDTTIKNETANAAFLSEAADIFQNFRVYALVLPQVHLVRATDELTTVVVPALERLQQALVARAKDVPGAAAALSDLATQIATIHTDTNGLSATLLGLTPAEWNANHAILSTPHQKLIAARAAAVQALADVRAVRAAIQ